ncbi:galactose-3-O-sulfotransferase 2-like [Lytechinus pictus]|uniref:galactose-3-O-sulfotransferase 2-like n=1 Tax=Lytechinus pictus TaxID=7653 RepID=UPI0030B9C9E7
MRYSKLQILLLLCTAVGFAILFLDLRPATTYVTFPSSSNTINRFSEVQPNQRFSANIFAGIKDHFFPSQCKPALSVVFVKTHKTGSTTMSSVINRFGFSRNDSFLLYKNDTSHGHFRQTILSDVRELLPPLGISSGEYDSYRDFDIMSSHVRFLPNIEFLRKYMRQGSRAITVLREPTRQWESAFIFFNCAKMMQILHKNATEKIETFFTSPLAYWNSTVDGQCKYYSRNGMWYDLSSNTAIYTNESEVYRELEILDQTLDLVLITEYLDESLLLLKKLMCWEYEDILYHTLNQRNATSVLNKYHEDHIRKWNRADVILYGHYNRTLWRKVQEYGPSFERDLTHFRTLLKEYMILCGIGDTIPRSKNRIAFVAHNSSSLCQSLVSDGNSMIVNRQKTPLHL